jgi:hypothetical protein
MMIYRSVLLIIGNVSDKLCGESKKKKIFFFENLAVYEIMWGKYCRAGQVTDDNMGHAHCIMDD